MATTMTKLLAGILAIFLTFLVLPGSRAEAGFGLGLKAPASFSLLRKASDCDDGEYEDGEGDEGQRFDAYRKRSAQPVKSPSAPAVKAVRIKIALPKETVAPKSQVKRANERVEVENSSIVAGHDRVAATHDAGCKNYFASAGMTASVACD
jgi:hypothetical protein